MAPVSRLSTLSSAVLDTSSAKLYFLPSFALVPILLLIRYYRRRSRRTAAIRESWATNTFLPTATEKSEDTSFSRYNRGSEIDSVRPLSPYSDPELPPPSPDYEVDISWDSKPDANPSAVSNTSCQEQYSHSTCSPLPMQDGRISPVAPAEGAQKPSPSLLSPPTMNMMEESCPRLCSDEETRGRDGIVGPAQLRKETVQLFHGVGLNKGRKWRRRIIQYG